MWEDTLQQFESRISVLDAVRTLPRGGISRTWLVCTRLHLDSCVETRSALLPRHEGWDRRARNKCHCTVSRSVLLSLVDDSEESLPNHSTFSFQRYQRRFIFITIPHDHESEMCCIIISHQHVALCYIMSVVPCCSIALLNRNVASNVASSIVIKVHRTHDHVAWFCFIILHHMAHYVGLCGLH